MRTNRQEKSEGSEQFEIRSMASGILYRILDSHEISRNQIKNQLLVKFRKTLHTNHTIGQLYSHIR